MKYTNKTKKQMKKTNTTYEKIEGKKHVRKNKSSLIQAYKLSNEEEKKMKNTPKILQMISCITHTLASFFAIFC